MKFNYMYLDVLGYQTISSLTNNFTANIFVFYLIHVLVFNTIGH